MALTTIPTVAVIVRHYDQAGLPVAFGSVTARLTAAVRYHGILVQETIEAQTDEHGFALIRLWPNVLSIEPSQYKFTLNNPDTGKNYIAYATIPDHDVFLDEIATPNEGDDTGGIGNPPSGGGTGGGTIPSTVSAGTTTTTAPGTPAQVINRGTPTARILDFQIPQGQPGRDGTNGLNGTGTITVKETITGAPGTAASVVNEGTGDRAELVFTIPAGVPGTGSGSGTGGSLPVGGTDGQILTKVGASDGDATWKSLSIVTDTLMGTYVWESTINPPPVLSTTTLDATTLAAYQAAIAEAPTGSKRAAAANSIITSMGTAQKLTLKRNGTTILTADYTGAMVLTNNGTNIGVTLATMTAISAIVAADLSTGTWTTEITGGTGYARKITLQVSPDVSTAPGQGFNPNVNLIIPRSVDGL